MITVLKLGGELLEDAAAMQAAAAAIVRLAAGGPLVVVHGGGRAIDAELRARGETPRFVDGLRITDAAALDTVVCVLAGRTNTRARRGDRRRAARGRSASRAPTAESAGRCRQTRSRRCSGERVDLGLVGQPDGTDVALLHDLLGLRLHSRHRQHRDRPRRARC